MNTNFTKFKIPFQDELSVLGKSLSFDKKTAPNRIVYQAMEGCDGNPNGSPGELTVRRYLRFAKGGPGIIWFEATACLPEAKANPRQLYLDKNTLPDFERLFHDIKMTCLKDNGYEPLIILQATHSGRYSKPHGVPEPLICYHNPNFEKVPLSNECIVTDSYLERVSEALIRTAALAKKAGADGVDMKSCHGYLLCELLSSYTRPGKYGGDFDGRTKLLVDTVKEATRTLGDDFLIASRLNVFDGYAKPYGFGSDENGEPNLKEPLELLKLLKNAGASLVNITMGNPYQNPHVNRPFSKGSYLPPETPLEGVSRIFGETAFLQDQLKELPLVLSGLSYLEEKSPAATAGMMEKGFASMAGFGRLTLAYPNLARDILRNGGLQKTGCCITCGKCSEIMRAGGTPGCVVRDGDVYLSIYKQYVK